jgi:hypothetical protein
MVMIFIFDDSFPAMALRLSIIELGGHHGQKILFWCICFVFCQREKRGEKKGAAGSDTM